MFPFLSVLVYSKKNRVLIANVLPAQWDAFVNLIATWIAKTAPLVSSIAGKTLTVPVRVDSPVIYVNSNARKIVAIGVFALLMVPTNLVSVHLIMKVIFVRLKRLVT